eukprot:Sspe_Gene.52512::Locus_29087_Transcript_1_1_Confidence_1.000_Length_797::g.52512::m.52512
MTAEARCVPVLNGMFCQKGHSCLKSKGDCFPGLLSIGDSTKVLELISLSGGTVEGSTKEMLEEEDVVADGRVRDLVRSVGTKTIDKATDVFGDEPHAVSFSAVRYDVLHTVR